ncbi:MAG: glycosyltransferase N-terminal domain-containing protein [Desulfarculaceae bacterium]
MDPTLLLYNGAATLATALLPGIWLGGFLARRFGDIWPRAGLFRDLAPAWEGPRVWLQAVSVGEVSVARAVCDELERRCPKVLLTVTTSTAKGLERARQDLGLTTQVAPFPLDLPWPVAAACRKIKPHVYASLETEIWPNLTAWLHNQGTSLLLLNGRISPRSFPRYRRFRPFMAPVLRRFTRLSMITPEDARRVEALGADPAKISVDGNAKYAGLSQRTSPELLKGPALLLALDSAPLLVAGSVRSGEEAPVLAAFKQVLSRHPKAVLAAAPRHVEKAGLWLEACADQDLQAQRWSSLSPAHPRDRQTQVVVIDVMGVLFALYGLARAAFVGASLVRLGGQNPMEPAAWGLPVFYGPSMEDFSDACQALEQAGASGQVADAAALARAWTRMLEDPQLCARQGESARKVVAGWSGAAAKSADIILEQLDRKGVLS